MFALPTLGRPEKIQRLIDSMNDDDRAEDFCVIYWEGDARLIDYGQVCFPSHWEHHITDCEFVSDKCNWYFTRYPTLPVYVGLSDDLTLGTPGMLRPWREGTRAWEFTWPNDGILQHMMATHAAVGNKLAHALARAQGGTFAHPLYKHNGFDVIWFRVALQLGMARYCPEYRIMVKHPGQGDIGEDDDTYRKMRPYNLAAWKDITEFPRDQLAAIIGSVQQDCFSGVLERAA